MLDSSMTLTDGRTLAYTECGSPDGPLVMYFHGAPTSRLDLDRFGMEEALVSAGVRVVSPDRPGYGGSSAKPLRTLGDWADDIAELADHLGRDRFAVMGLSAGGPYVVACASLLPGRVASAGIVAGVTDMAWPGSLENFDDDEATIMGLADEGAAVRWCEEQYGVDGSAFFEGGMDLAAADLEFIQDESTGRGFIETVLEAFRQGVGPYAQDLMVYVQPWSFDLATITAPVQVLHGEADTIVPIAHGRHTAELIPGASLVTFPKHGHLSIVTEIPQLTTDLARALA